MGLGAGSWRDRRRRALTLALGASLLAAGCGGHTRPPHRRTLPRVTTLAIVAGLPLQGPDRSQSIPLLRGMRLALRQAHNRAGGFHIAVDWLDDSTAAGGVPDATQTALNALSVSERSRVILYLGDMTSAATEVSLPILNQAGIPQLSPSSGYDGLTVTAPGTAAGEPNLYLPSGHHTFLRLVPRDLFQAAALLRAMRQDGCRQIAVAGVRSKGSREMGALLAREAQVQGIRIASQQILAGAGGDLSRFIRLLHAERADCVLLTATRRDLAVALAEDAASAVPHMRLYVTSALCTRSFTAASAGGIDAGLATRTQCASPVPDLAAEPAGRIFLAAYHAAYGASNPDPYAALGYESMRLALSVIARLGLAAEARQEVLRGLLAARVRGSLIGDYSFDARGDISRTSFGLYAVGPDGRPSFRRMLTAG